MTMYAGHFLKFSLRTRLGLTIIIMGIVSLLLILYTQSNYRMLAYETNSRALTELIKLESQDIRDKLAITVNDLGQAIEEQPGFSEALQKRDKNTLASLLYKQYNQYFVTAGIVQPVKLYVLDTSFNMLSASSEGRAIDVNAPLICPGLSQKASKRTGPGKLRIISKTCLHENRPVFASILPSGGLTPVAYIQVVADYSYNLQHIHEALGFPLHLKLITGETTYKTDDWDQLFSGNQHIAINHVLHTDDNIPALQISLLFNTTRFDAQLAEQRNLILITACLVIAATVFLVMFILQHSTIGPLAQLQHILEKISYSESQSELANRVMFKDLLEQIIILRKMKNQSFSVMLLDLNHFEDINKEHGRQVGDKVLAEVGSRLSGILRDSDLISWIGTDTPGHKLLPADTKTEYRATIARLGGDEFGLLLPSAETRQQASAVAKRVHDALMPPFDIDGSSITITCSIGISMFPEHGDNEQVLIRKADKAMFQAKTNNSGYQLFEPAENDSQAA